MKKVFVSIYFLLSLTHGFGQTTNIKTMVDSLQFMRADTLDCKADLYWRIIAQGGQAIPFLIDKLNDTTETNVTLHCKISKLNIGEISYFALREIASFPIYVITELQFDLVENGCWSFYSYLFDNANKKEFQEKVKNWYTNNESKHKRVSLSKKEMNSCKRKYKIDSFLDWEN